MHLWSRIVPLFLLFGLMIVFPAHAEGLDKARDILEVFQEELLLIIPIVAIIALVLLGIGYATNFVEKDTFVRWAVGLLIAGSAIPLTRMFFDY